MVLRAGSPPVAQAGIFTYGFKDPRTLQDLQRLYIEEWWKIFCALKTEDTMSMSMFDFFF